MLENLHEPFTQSFRSFNEFQSILSKSSFASLSYISSEVVWVRMRQAASERPKTIWVASQFGGFSQKGRIKLSRASHVGRSSLTWPFTPAPGDPRANARRSTPSPPRRRRRGRRRRPVLLRAELPAPRVMLQYSRSRSQSPVEGGVAQRVTVHFYPDVVVPVQGHLPSLPSPDPPPSSPKPLCCCRPPSPTSPPIPYSPADVPSPNRAALRRPLCPPG